ncbi:hypothetical protein V1477_001977 [Vespula maculifrons]|uniref:Uncharacterized protein n=1 Tax=Vespula maculifrons TaxID=7453 RepID=A0ABD2CXN1_VESMC
MMMMMMIIVKHLNHDIFLNKCTQPFLIEKNGVRSFAFATDLHSPFQISSLREQNERFAFPCDIRDTIVKSKFPTPLGNCSNRNKYIDKTLPTKSKKTKPSLTNERIRIALKIRQCQSKAKGRKRLGWFYVEESEQIHRYKAEGQVSGEDISRGEIVLFIITLFLNIIYLINMILLIMKLKNDYDNKYTSVSTLENSKGNATSLFPDELSSGRVLHEKIGVSTLVISPDRILRVPASIEIEEEEEEEGDEEEEEEEDEEEEEEEEEEEGGWLVGWLKENNNNANDDDSDNDDDYDYDYDDYDDNDDEDKKNLEICMSRFVHANSLSSTLHVESRLLARLLACLLTCLFAKLQRATCNVQRATGNRRRHWQHRNR